MRYEPYSRSRSPRRDEICGCRAHHRERKDRTNEKAPQQQRGEKRSQPCSDPCIGKAMGRCQMTREIRTENENESAEERSESRRELREFKRLQPCLESSSVKPRATRIADDVFGIASRKPRRDSDSLDELFRASSEIAGACVGRFRSTRAPSALSSHEESRARLVVPAPHRLQEPDRDATGLP